jgi:hypothetical protein
MSEQDLLNLSRSITANEVSWFGQIITINFAMLFNGAFWLLAIGVFCLLFFWKEKSPT